MAKKSVKINPKEQYTRIFLEAADWDSSDESVEKYKPVFWYNYRDKDIGGLRLTEKGFEFVTKNADLKIYRVDFPSDFSFTPQTVIWLDQYLNSPYYIDKRSITVISERAAFELYLFNGDVRKYGSAKAMSNRLAQD
jgi:hypothetical protein